MPDFEQSRGKLFVLFGPSGSGKSTLKKLITERFPAEVLKAVTTVTTRSPRPGEADGVDYFFIDLEEFDGLNKAGLFFESTNFLGNFYATPLSEINFLNLGQNLILAVELDGLKKFAPLKNAVLIFVTTEAQELTARIVARNPGIDKKLVEQRLVADVEQIHAALKNINFNYTLVNHDLSTAVAELDKIIRQEIAEK